MKRYNLSIITLLFNSGLCATKKDGNYKRHAKW